MKRKKLGLYRYEIDEVFSNKKTKKIYSKNMSLFFLPTNEINKTRISFVVPKKEVKKVVKRNLLKRRGRYIFNNIFKKNNDGKGYKCVIHFKKGAQYLPFSDLKNEIYTLLKKAKII